LTVTNANGCASSGHSFTVTINTQPSAPTGSSTQTLCSGATVASLSATGSGILWYAAGSGGSPLATDLTLVNGTHYYASQTVSGCESSGRLDVTATVFSSGSWMGTTSTNWFTTTNWCGGTLPTSSTNVTIAAGLSNYPSIGTTGAVCNNISIASGASLTIVGSNTLTVSGNWTHSGTFTANTSTVNFNGTGTGSVGASNFYNVTFSGAGAKSAAGALAIAGSVSITNNFTAGSYTHTVSGNWSNSGTFTATGSTIDFNGSGAGNIGAGNFNNVTFSGAGAKTATGALTIAGNVSITGNFTAGSYTHSVGGNWSKSGSFTATGSTIDFNGSGAGNIGTGNFNNVTFSGAGTKTATGILNIAGAVSITDNFSAGNYLHTVQGNWSNSGTFHANSSTISFIGTSSTINGSTSIAFNNLTLNETGGATLGIATSVAGTLTLTLGLLDIGNFNLTILSGGSISGGSATSYVKTSGSGRLKQTVPGLGSVTKNYPVGHSAYNPMAVKYNNVAVSDNFSIRVEDATITNANSSKTVNRKWFLIEDAAGTADLTLAATYNTGEGGSGFSNSSSPQVGYFDGTSWAYRPITSGSGTTTFTATGSAPDFTNTYGFFVLGSDDAFNATKLAVTNLAPANPSVGLANTTITVQSQNSQSVPTMVGTATGFNLSCTNTTMSTIPSGSIGQYTYETSVAPITFTESTLNTGTSTYDHDATVTATGTSGETLSAGTSGVFDVYESKIYEPKANGNWSTTSNWRYSTNGGSTWRDTTAVTTFSDTELIRIPLGITLTDNVTASFYSMLIYGTLDVSSSGNLTLYHSAFSDYNIHVHGTLKNSGGTLTNSDVAYPFEIHGGTYWHNMNGGSIPVCTWYTLNTTLSACKVEGTGVGGLNQSFENFTLTSGTQTLTGDMNVSAALTLTAGKIATGSYHVISGLNGTVSSAGGYINGILRRYVESTVTTGDFPVGDVNYYAPFSISCTGTPSGNGYLDVSTTAAQPPMASGLSQSKYVNRKWTISNNGVTGITAYSPSCTFADGDKVGSPATGSLKLRKLTASTWFTTNGTATGNIITATGLSTAGLTATSDFYAGEDDCSSTNAVWLGSSSTDWNTTTNWCGGSVPASTADVTIPSSPARQPVIGAAGGTCKNITIQSGASLTISGAYTLDVKGNWSNSGTFTAGTGTVSFTGSSAQTITGATIFNNLTINNTASIGEGNSRATILSEGITVNGILNLQSANASSTQGTLHTGTYTLSMLNASASVTGTGDVTGIVRRTHTFTPNVPYQFGSQYTTINFLGTGTQPGEISCKITIGSAMTGKDGSVKRYYSFARPVLESPTDQVTLNLRYLALELNGNDETETKLVIWDHHSTGTIEQHGKTNNSTSNDWVGLSGLGATYIVRTALDNRLWSLADYTTTKKMWVGVLDTDWANGGNWAPPGAPVPTDTVLIPVVGQGNYYPTFTSNVEIRSLEIAGGATVTADSYTLTINGSTGAWLNNGTFVPGTGTLILNHGNLNEIVSVSGIGTNQFHNILIGANTFIRPGTGFCMKINGGVSAQLSSIVDLSANDNTVEYNGASQTIVDPSHSGYRGYYNIIFSGTGTSTLYDGTLDISGNFTSNGTLDLSGSTVSFIGNTAQAINGTVVFNNLTINSSGGVTSSDDITVTGTLYLQSENPSSLDTGTLAMASGKILNLGVDAATTGTSDVSGIIKRTHTFATNTFYSFGNTEQGVTFPVTSGQTLPSSLSVRVTIGSTPCWGTSCIDNPANVTKRLYEFAQIGGSATKAIFRVNYKDNELAGGVNESTLSIWNRVVGTPTVIADKGWSNYDVDAEYISISDVNIALLSSTLSDFQLAIAPTSSSYKTWNGSQSTDWNTPANWTPNGVPTTSLGAIIPDDNTTVYQPTLPASGSTQATCQYLNIQTNGVLNSGGSDGATLTIVDGIVGDAWGMEAGGTFNAGNSTVIFANLNPTDVASLSGSTDFYNVTIASDSKLRPAGNSYMGIAGALVISGTFSAATNENTIEFKGGSGTQSIPNPNGGAAGYHNLILSGSGTKTLPTTLNIVDEFTNNTTAANKVDAATNSSEVIFSGIAYGQAISGTTATNFNNLTLNNSYGLTLNGVDASVDGTLTFTSGKITTDANRLILGNSASVSGAGSGKYVFGNLQRGIAAFTSTKTFEIGNSANYLPVIIDFAGTATNGTGNITCSTTDGQHPEYGSALLSEAKYLNRYWTVTNSGVTFGTYDATFTFINPDDIEGSATPALLLIKEYSGSAWSSTTSGSSSSTTVKTTNNTTFGDFVAGEALSLTTDYFRSKASGNWSSLSTWESSASGNTGTWNPASLVPDHTAHSITISGGHVVTVDATASASNLTITGTLTSGSGIALSVDGTWVNNGTFNPGTGTVTFNGTSAQTVSGNNTLNNLTINNTA
ncbi:MAG: hypothetical protein NTV01_05450, partial [Bacteroidia bacterium]|nr:hypothetical protein [Bacteroidia bacterium]